VTNETTPEIPDNWAWSNIGEVVHTRVDQSGPEPIGSFLYVDISSIDTASKKIAEPKTIPASEAPSRARQRIKPQDVLVSMTRPNLNAVAIVPEDFENSIGSTGFDVLRAQHVEPRWLFYLVQTTAFVESMSMLVQGALYPAVRPKDIRGYRIPIAPIQEQRRIFAEVEKQITRLDAAVAALRRVQANLKRYRAAVLRAAYEGCLVPTEAELAHHEGRPYEPASVLLERILTERRFRLDANQRSDSGGARNAVGTSRRKARDEESTGPDQTRLPPLREGWVWTSLGQLFSVCIGATPSRAKPEFWGGDIAWVSSGEVGFCRIRETREKITSLGLAHTSTLMHQPGTVLLGMIGEGKTRGQVAILEIEACNNQNSAAIRVPDTPIPPEYVYRFLEGEYDRTRRRSSGGNQPALNKERVKAIPVPLPPIAEIQRIVAELERCSSLIDQLEKQVAFNTEKAERLRQAVLKRAFDGRLAAQDPNDEPADALLQRIRGEGREKPHPKTQKKGNEGTLHEQRSLLPHD
jgi:type I restriction enzyme S subunit